VSVSLPTGNSLEYEVDRNCTLKELRGVIRDNEGIPEEMQNYLALSTAKPGDWETFVLCDLFPENYNAGKDSLDLQIVLGPLNGGLGEIDCCLCGCSCFHQGTCYAYICKIGLGCTDDYKKVSCQVCCMRGRCCSLM